LETARNREHPLIAGFSLVLVADAHMSLFGRVRLDLGGKERVEITTEEAALHRASRPWSGVWGLRFRAHQLFVLGDELFGELVDVHRMLVRLLAELVSGQVILFAVGDGGGRVGVGRKVM
jgi:hypothetical protein